MQWFSTASTAAGYPIHAGDLRGVTKITDFYSARQWHSTAMYTDFDRLMGIEHCLMLCLPEAPPLTAGPGRHVRLTLDRRSGPDFSERDRAVLTLLRPHLHHAYLDAERRRHPVPRLTPRQRELLRLVAAGHTNTQIARHLGIYAVFLDSRRSKATGRRVQGRHSPGRRMLAHAVISS